MDLVDGCLHVEDFGLFVEVLFVIVQHREVQQVVDEVVDELGCTFDLEAGVPQDYTDLFEVLGETNDLVLAQTLLFFSRGDHVVNLVQLGVDQEDLSNQ